jgi:PhnB protein
MADSFIPKGYHTLTPYLTVHDAATAITFYREAFGAEEVMRLGAGGNKIMHAEIRIGDAHLMLADEFPEWGNTSPKTLGGSSSSIMMYVPDVDSVFETAVAAGAKVVMEVQDQFYGDRSGSLEDPFGHRWTIATVSEILSPEEIDRRFREWEASQSDGAPGE